MAMFNKFVRCFWRHASQKFGAGFACQKSPSVTASGKWNIKCVHISKEWMNKNLGFRRNCEWIFPKQLCKVIIGGNGLTESQPSLSIKVLNAQRIILNRARAGESDAAVRDTQQKMTVLRKFYVVFVPERHFCGVSQNDRSHDATSATCRLILSIRFLISPNCITPSSA